MKSFPLLLISILLAGIPFSVKAAVPEIKPGELPRIPPTGVENALETFEIKDGFRVDLIVSEPLVVDPVAISFDENGQLYVIEMIDYSERRDETLGQVKLLRDTDGDGVYDESTVFAEGLGWPTAIICYNGGVFVASSPDIIWLKDTNGDGRADERKTIFTGFGTHSKRLNVQALLNNLTWGPDNRIHGATSGNGGTVRSLVHPEKPPIELRSRDFSFDPKTFDLRAEAGGGQHGMSFDNRGQKFVTNNSHHLRTLMYEERYGNRNRFYNPPRNLIDIPVDGPAAEVYRISPDEPWRITRTRWRVEGIVPGIIEGGGRVSGYFTGASGGTIYRGDAFPAEFFGDAFVGDVGGNLVHRKKIRYNGVEPVAERPEDEQEVEFLASTDIWFRPVDFENAPDGTLYVLDMYREVIEHPWSLPEEIKKHLDLNSGNDRGRIYRIAPTDFEQPEPVRLGELSTAELVKTLGHPNGWHRDTAGRLLYEREDPESEQLLEAFLEESDQPPGRLSALYALDGGGFLQEKHILAGMNDADDRVRQHAVRLSEKFSKNRIQSSAIFEKLKLLASDPSPFVRYQLAFTLGEFQFPGRIAALAEIVKQDFNDRWISAAVLTSLSEGAGELFAELSESDLFENPSFSKLIDQVLGIIAAKNQPDEIAAVVNFLSRQPAEKSFSSIRRFGEGLGRAGSSIEKVIPNDLMREIYRKAMVTVEDRNLSPGMRTEAIYLLGMIPKPETGRFLLTLLKPDESQEIQLAAITVLDQLNADNLLVSAADDWNIFTPRIRSELLSVFLKTSGRSIDLLELVRKGTILRSEISSTELAFLRNHREAEVRRLVLEVFAEKKDEERLLALERFRASLRLSGNLERGRNHFRMLCSSCHRDGDIGHALGPDRTAFKSAGKESLLANIIDPNAQVEPAFVAYLVETKDGQSYFGLIVDENEQTVTLRQAFGREEVLFRNTISGIRSQEISMMPEGLEAALDEQGMADLLEYLIRD